MIPLIYLVNMSKIQLNEQQHIQVLWKGLKFLPTPRSINTVNNIVNCEKSLFSAPLIIKNAAISQMSTFIQKMKKNKKAITLWTQSIRLPNQKKN